MKAHIITQNSLFWLDLKFKKPRSLQAGQFT